MVQAWRMFPLEAYASSTSVKQGEQIKFYVNALTRPEWDADNAGWDVVNSQGLKDINTLNPPYIMEIYKSSDFNYRDSGQLMFEIATRTISTNRSYRDILLHLKAEAVTQAEPISFSQVNAVPIFTDAEGRIPSDGDALDACLHGCNWTESVNWTVPADFPPGVYIARFRPTNPESDPERITVRKAFVLFVVRPAQANTNSKILCQLSCTTYQAYNPWLGYCYYGLPLNDYGNFFQSPASLGVSAVSFHRPTQLWDFILYEQPIVAWMERNYPNVEFCTNLDLHFDENLLTNRHLFISCGHDEYWSQEMLNRIQTFGEQGGNVLFLSANSCYHRVLLERDTANPDNVIMRQDYHNDLTDWSVDDRCGFRRVNFSAGGPGYYIERVGFTVRQPGHWIFQNTNLQAGDVFGAEEGIIGYETDAMSYEYIPLSDGTYVRPRAGSLDDFVILAETVGLDVSKGWHDDGMAHMGLFRRNSPVTNKPTGIVLSAGTTNWAQGLRQDAGNVHLITKNMVNRLRFKAESQNIYPITQDGNLRWYKYLSPDVPDADAWAAGSGTAIGLGGWDQFKQVLSGSDGLFYAVTQDGNLRWYKYLSPDVPDADAWAAGSGTAIGVGGWDQFKQILGGRNGLIYALTHTGNLLWYKNTSLDQPDANAWASGWSTAVGLGGWDQFKRVFGGYDGVIYAITQDGKLLWYKNTSFNQPDADAWAAGSGTAIGLDIWGSFKDVFGGQDGVIYAITWEGDLLWYKYLSLDAPDVNAWAAGSGMAIGLRGWNNFKQIYGDEPVPETVG